jgi:hypothetical protein
MPDPLEKAIDWAWHETKVQAAVRAERERCAKIADQWLDSPTMRLRAGKMTAQEIRSVKAVVTSIAAVIRSHN